MHPIPFVHPFLNSPPPASTSTRYQLFDVVNDPGERNDLINDTSLASIVEEMKQWYAQERASAHYPENRGKSGKPVYVQNSDPLAKVTPVWLPWL